MDGEFAKRLLTNDMYHPKIPQSRKDMKNPELCLTSRSPQMASALLSLISSGLFDLECLGHASYA